MRKLLGTVCLSAMLLFGGVQAAFATSQYYHFDDNIPPRGWCSSSYKKLPAGVSFRTTMLSCTATDGSNQGSLGTLMKPVRSDQYQYSYKTVRPGYQNYVLLSASGSARTIRIDQQAVGTSWVDDTGYWYF